VLPRHICPNHSLAMQPLWQCYPFSKQLYPLLHELLEDHNPLLLTPSYESTLPRSQYTVISKETNAIETTANSQIYARFVPDHTPPGTASQRGSPGLIKPTPWTPLRLFILEHELCNHPDRVFVRQLIDNLLHNRLDWSPV